MIAIILSLDLKLSVFDNITWKVEWQQNYKDQFVEFYYDNYDEAETRQPASAQESYTDGLTSLLRCSRRTNSNIISDDGEIGLYLTDGMSDLFFIQVIILAISRLISMHRSSFRSTIYPGILEIKTA